MPRIGLYLPCELSLLGIFAGFRSYGIAGRRFQAQPPLRLSNRLLAFANGANRSGDAPPASVDPDGHPARSPAWRSWARRSSKGKA